MGSCHKTNHQNKTGNNQPRYCLYHQRCQFPYGSVRKLIMRDVVVNIVITGRACSTLSMGAFCSQEADGLAVQPSHPSGFPLFDGHQPAAPPALACKGIVVPSRTRRRALSMGGGFGGAASLPFAKRLKPSMSHSLPDGTRHCPDSQPGTPLRRSSHSHAVSSAEELLHKHLRATTPIDSRPLSELSQEEFMQQQKLHMMQRAGPRKSRASISEDRIPSMIEEDDSRRSSELWIAADFTTPRCTDHSASGTYEHEALFGRKTSDSSYGSDHEEDSLTEDISFASAAHQREVCSAYRGLSSCPSALLNALEDQYDDQD